MRKRVLALCLILVFALGITAQAAEVLSVRTVPKITFDGTTATCTVNVRGDKTTITPRNPIMEALRRRLSMSIDIIMPE